MRPLTVLLGIVMGSTVSIAVALALTLVVFVALPDEAERLEGELAPLARTLAAAVALAALSVASFYGELRARAWRRLAHGALAAALLATAWATTAGASLPPAASEAPAGRGSGRTHETRHEAQAEQRGIRAQRERPVRQ